MKAGFELASVRLFIFGAFCEAHCEAHYFAEAKELVLFACIESALAADCFFVENCLCFFGAGCRSRLWLSVLCRCARRLYFH